MGNKAAMLGELMAAGVRVPDGVVLDAESSALPAGERNALLVEAAAALGGERYAVRSSGISEDGADRSFAGLYETVLDVPASELLRASEIVLQSGPAGLAHQYDPGASGEMAVIVQLMVDADTAGVAFTADPVTGDRDVTVVSAVKGLGARLVSGAETGDEWQVRGNRSTPVRLLANAIDGRLARAIAQEARRIADRRGSPQDIEWAVDGGGRLWILQARPMTGLPPEATWDPPKPGAYSRGYRFGEWISEPVTPLFESWLLTTMEERFHAGLREAIGQSVAQPYHVLVNGWYFYTLNWASPRAFLGNAPRMLARALRSPRRVAGILPATVRHSFPLAEREWRDELQPRYRAAVERARQRVESAPVLDLPSLIDDLANLAGEYFLSIAALTGAAYKAELNLASFYRKHLREQLGWSHLPLVSGFEPPANPEADGIASLDWWFAPARLGPQAQVPPAVHAGVMEARRAAEAAAVDVLKSAPGRLRTFKRTLAEAQHLLAVRDEQTRELTIAWPVMRRAVLRIGASLTERGYIDDPDDVFFLTRVEALEALTGARPERSVDVNARRSRRVEQASLVPPLVVGRLPRMADSMWKRFSSQVGATRSAHALVSGTPASAGRATGVVRVIRGPDEFDSFQAGEVLVAPITAPAWTPLFPRAAALITDVGSAASHAALIAREYGIPAVVGTGDATSRLRTGMRVTVDGSTGNVEPA
ncbi:MAG TPA: PEP/pyruvate-binding domain-containing protein [Patescibacteria group bacterium]|nr:PEP/pyruvate-binding domain-containing protein [Patescibacteria group bacterium]